MAWRWILAQVGHMTYGNMLGMFDAQIVNARHYAMRTRWLAALSPAVIAELVAAGGARTSPLSFIVLHHFRRAAARVSPSATAFGVRQEHFMLEIVAAWEPGAGDKGDTHRQWADKLWRTLAPDALPGGYANLLGPDDRDQIPLAHGQNTTGLREAKHRFDPDNIFSVIPLWI